MPRGIGFRPSLWPTLISVPVLILLLGLGTWQVQRMHWKTALIERLESRMAAPAMDLPATLDDLDAAEYRRARVAGRFLHDREMYRLGYSPRGDAGFYVVTPLLRAGAPPVLVNRGWVPPQRKDPARRPAAQPPGQVTVEGIVRKAQVPGWFTPDNEPDNNLWFTIDPAAMGRAAGLDRVAPVYLQALAAEAPRGAPLGLPNEVNLRNQHLQYVIIWYALALALAVIYVLYHRQRGLESAP
jgi:surfeit locus 1 family protein